MVTLVINNHYVDIGESGDSSESCYSGDLGDYGHSSDFN